MLFGNIYFICMLRFVFLYDFVLYLLFALQSIYIIIVNFGTRTLVYHSEIILFLEKLAICLMK